MLAYVGPLFSDCPTWKMNENWDEYHITSQESKLLEKPRNLTFDLHEKLIQNREISAVLVYKRIQEVG